MNNQTETTAYTPTWNWCEPENGLTIEECEQIVREMKSEACKN